jgi:hypothetical protein
LSFCRLPDCRPSKCQDFELSTIKLLHRYYPTQALPILSKPILCWLSPNPCGGTSYPC